MATSSSTPVPRAVLVVLAAIPAALALRWSLILFESEDFLAHVGPWYRFLRDNGRFWALSADFSNYSVGYLYLLTLGTYAAPGVPALLVVKAISISFDFISALCASGIVRMRTGPGLPPAAAFCLVLFAPTIVLNSSYWGQADSVYSAFLLGCLWALCANRQALACVLFGAALSVKLQAVFLAPLLVLLAAERVVSVRALALVPISFLASLIPAWLAGRPALDLLAIYGTQFRRYEALTMNAPNVYQWIPNEFYAVAVPVGIVVAGFAALLLAAAARKSSVEFDPKILVCLAMASVLWIPYLLPKMHERYFYPADLISIPFAFYFPSYWYVPLLVIGSSLLAYFPYLFGESPVPLLAVAVVLLIASLAVLRCVSAELGFSPRTPGTSRRR